MKFTLSWLKDHLQTEASLDEIATKLTLIGLEVESIEDPAGKLRDFTIARVLEAEPHPNADKLRVLKVETGAGVVQVVCGAPNARKGLIGVFAAPGVHVPGIGVTLGKATIRGVDSAGMLCSERELELSTGHSGIIELPGRMEKHIGERFVDAMALNDPVIDIAITPNRPDCLGVRGVARDLAAAGLGKLKPVSHGYTGEGKFDCPIPIRLQFPKGSESACPVFAGRVLRGVTNRPSPEWMQRRLRAIGLRPINAAADVTNYISFDRARPLHVYDADKLRGPIMARLGKKGESFAGLDGKTYEVDETMCVIADKAHVLGLGGIMGGETTGATEATTSIFIESAYFDPARTAATGRQTGINSDARFRFERGIDPQSEMEGLNLATKMILEFCGGEPSSAAVSGHEPGERAAIRFDPARVQKLSGAKFTNAEIVSTLKKLGFRVDGKAPSLSVTPPSWRPDIHGAADLVEEAVRLSGADRIPPAPLPRDPGVAKAVLTASQKRVLTARRALAARGFVEAITWSFITEAHARHFGGGAAGLRLANPISNEMTDMRPGLLPGLLAAARANANRGFQDVALFEVGQVFRGEAPEDQSNVAGGVRAGTDRFGGGGRHWDGAAKPAGVFDAKADALAVLTALGADAGKLQTARNAPSWYHPGRSGTLQLGPKNVLAHFGELHPETLKALDLQGAAAVFEVFLDSVPAPRRKGTAKGPLIASDFQPVQRDFAFLVDKSVDAAAVLRAAEGAEKSLISRVSIFDVFEGQGVPPGKKSLGLEITLTPLDRTLTEAEIEAVSAKVVAQVQKATGAGLRG
ncbi:MAG: phenylalanine--tRNA ligase subunit beta [Rhodomicrobium sp.]